MTSKITPDFIKALRQWAKRGPKDGTRLLPYRYPCGCEFYIFGFGIPPKKCPECFKGKA